ncbi:MAG: prolipoprotein diacylglyceryl transferase [Pseudomonadota bacterium]
MALSFPDINPVLLQFGETPFKITWYSLSYVVGIILGWIYVKHINKIGSVQPPIKDKSIDDLITALILGIILGGRLGYVLFYDLDYNLSNPANIIKTWEGGMSFHGGLLGVIIAIFIYCKINKLKFFKIMDLLACATPIGLCFGRIANFINAELYGRYTNSSLGVIFPGDVTARHASQLYESALEGVLLFIILYLLYTRTKIQQYCGMLSGFFLLFYAMFRTILENFREPDAHIGFVFFEYTMGQLLSLPMIIAGLIIIFYSLKTHKK